MVSRKPLVLAVDDELDVLKLVESALKDLGYEVVTAMDGSMAIQAARTRRPDLIVMDVNMPLTHGLRALEFLRKSPETSTIPVIFLTGENSTRMLPVVEHAQRTAFLKKPVDLEALDEMCHEMLRRYGASDAA